MTTSHTCESTQDSLNLIAITWASILMRPSSFMSYFNYCNTELLTCDIQDRPQCIFFSSLLKLHPCITHFNKSSDPWVVYVCHGGAVQYDDLRVCQVRFMGRLCCSKGLTRVWYCSILILHKIMPS